MGSYGIDIAGSQMQQTRDRHEEYYGRDEAVELMDQALELWEQARQEAIRLDQERDKE